MTTMQLKLATGSFQLAAQTKNIAKLLAIGSIATGAVALMSAAPTQAAVIGSGQLAFSDGVTDFFGNLGGSSFSVTFDPNVPGIVPPSGSARINSATGDFTTPSGGSFSTGQVVLLSSQNATFNNLGGGSYQLVNDLPFSFTGTGVTVTVNGGSLFSLDYNDGNRGASISAFGATGRITNADGTVLAQQLAFSFSDLPGFGGGGYNIQVSPTAVPEPFTIIGTVIGGATAFRMRKRFKADNKL